METHGAQLLRCRKVSSKIIRKHEKAFPNFGKSSDKILSKIDIFYLTHDTLSAASSFSYIFIYILTHGTL